ncbi:MAG: hypothetical protein WD734_00860 [Dehalococcoidia bacterium]
MAHPILERVERELPPLGYVTQPVAGPAGQPAQLLVHTTADEPGEERWLLLTVFEEVEDDLEGAYLVQIFCALRTAAPARERRGELSRFIVAVNNKLSVGQFCFREEDAILYFRTVAMLPDAPETWTRLLDAHLTFAIFQVVVFGPSIEAVADGRQTAHEAAAANQFTGPLA